MRTVLFWVITRGVVVILYRSFGTTYRSHLVESKGPLKMGKLILNLGFISYLLPRLPTISDRHLGLQIQYTSGLKKCEMIFESISADLNSFLRRRVSCGKQCIYRPNLVDNNHLCSGPHVTWPKNVMATLRNPISMYIIRIACIHYYSLTLTFIRVGA
jgi:hypothetical protein